MDFRKICRDANFRLDEPMQNAVLDLIPSANDKGVVEPPAHKSHPENCWCSPQAWEVYNEDGTVAYFIIDHNWIQ